MKQVIILLASLVLVIVLTSSSNIVNEIPWQEFGLNNKQAEVLNRYIASHIKEKETLPQIIKCDLRTQHLIEDDLLRESFKNYTFIRLLFEYTLKNPSSNFSPHDCATIAIDSDGKIIDDLGNFSKGEFSLLLRNQKIKITSVDDIRNVVHIYCILNQLEYNQQFAIQELGQNKWKIIQDMIHYENNPMIRERDYYWLLEVAEDKTFKSLEYHIEQF